MTPTATYPWESPISEKASALAGRLCGFLPELQTARLILRAPALADFPTYAEILGADAAGHLGGPFDREAALLDFSQYVASWMLRGSGLWAVERRDDQALIGFVLVAMEYGDMEPELGFLFTAEAQGYGYASEATKAARDFALQDLELPVLVSYVAPENTRAAALADRLGAWPDDAAATEIEDPVTVWRHAPAKGALS